MINNELALFIERNCVFAPTEGQERAIRMLSDFVLSGRSDDLCVMTGYAGTGKTSLLAAFVRAMVALKRKVVLMAPTGRAAKVFAVKSGMTAYTIHKRIYRQRAFSADLNDFSRNVNLLKHTLFIVDEASMIASSATGGAPTGTGCLLDDLVHFVYSGEGCRLMLVGDTAQLPPVGEELSAALSKDYLSGYGLEVFSCQLDQVVRQHEESGILWNATNLRAAIVADACFVYPKIRGFGFPDLRYLSGSELIETLEECYYKYGEEETIVVTRSNKRCNIYNNGIRSRILGREEELTAGDRILVVKNNYFWKDGSEEQRFDFIANGDMAVVRRFRRERSLYGFRFADVTLSFPDYDDFELDATVLLDALQSEAPALTWEQGNQLFCAVEEDYMDVHPKSERLKRMKQDPYLNALQVKYAYAVTCHKAQGGQWSQVFVDQGYLTEDMLSPEYYRWLYTAFTRATGTLYLVNWPEECRE